MSNNAHVNDDEIEIHQLPEVSTLQAGMMVAVDSQPTGTKSFNLTTALEGKASASDFTALENTVAEKANTSDVTTALEGKVDTPTTTPAEGQVLTFNGSANTWANPPEGVYVLNYSEVTQLSDIDITRAKSQPTYIRIDDTDITISVPYHYGTTTLPTRSITLKVGTMLKLTHINSSDQFFFSTVYHDGFYGSNPPVGSYGTFFPVLELYNAGSLVKGWSVSGEVMDENMYGGMPIPFTKYYINSRSPGQISNANYRKNGMEMEFQWNGNFRSQYLPPAEIQDHDFSNDETPEQIQFMGWGATSNRAGYKTTLKSHDVVDSTTYPDQTPEVQFTRVVAGNPSTADADQIYTHVSATVKSADGQSKLSYQGMLAPIAPASRVGYLTCWSDSKGSHFGWRPPIENIGALTDAATISTNRLNNNFATLATSQSALTLVAQVDTDEVINFCLEITPSVNCTLTVKKQIGQSTTITTLMHSVAGGNTLEANKTYQVTAVGNCWTLAAFES